MAGKGVAAAAAARAGKRTSTRATRATAAARSAVAVKEEPARAKSSGRKAAGKTQENLEVHKQPLKKERGKPAKVEEGDEDARTEAWKQAELEDVSMKHYMYEEWGRKERNDNKLFEKITLEGAQSGLSWALILKKRPGYRKAFRHFDIATVRRTCPP